LGCFGAATVAAPVEIVIAGFAGAAAGAKFKSVRFFS
jgi:hypothetical protein